MDDEELFEEDFETWIGDELRCQFCLISFPIFFILMEAK